MTPPSDREILRRYPNLDEWLKLAEHNGDGCGDLVNYGYDRSSIAERYLWENVSCHVHIRLKCSDRCPNPHEYCAEFYPVVKVRHLEANRLLKNPCGEEEAGRAALDPATRHHHYGRKPVLVGVRQIPEHLEGMKVQPDGKLLVESVVWLKPLDQCDVGGVNFFEAALDGFRPIFRVANDGELGRARLVDLSVGVVQGELEHEIVQHFAEVGQDVAGGMGHPTKRGTEIGRRSPLGSGIREIRSP